MLNNILPALMNMQHTGLPGSFTKYKRNIKEEIKLAAHRRKRKVRNKMARKSRQRNRKS